MCSALGKPTLPGRGREVFRSPSLLQEADSRSCWISFKVQCKLYRSTQARSRGILSGVQIARNTNLSQCTPEKQHCLLGKPLRHTKVSSTAEENYCILPLLNRWTVYLPELPVWRGGGIWFYVFTWLDHKSWSKRSPKQPFRIGENKMKAWKPLPTIGAKTEGLTPWFFPEFIVAK